MSKTTRRLSTIGVVGALLAGALLSAGATPAAAAPADDGTIPAGPIAIHARHAALPAPPAVDADSPPDDKLGSELRNNNTGDHTVFVQFAGAGAAETAAAAGLAPADAKASAADRRAELSQTYDSAVAQADAVDPATQKLFTVSNAVPGVALHASTEAIANLATRSDVVKISVIRPKTVDNAGAAQLTKVLDTWRSTGKTGAGVEIGVIDTGIDYTHADFGGPGTPDAYAAAIADPVNGFVPTAKVVGGHDFVGDDYDAIPTSPTYQPVPHPDSDPIDCAGHGTHVAGTVAGYGVNADGSTFSGDYSTLDGAALNSMGIGPGMAPQASLYALKVFGCGGGTDFTIAALDWALDPNGDGDFSDHLDIVNLSLGVDFAPVDDPDNLVIDTVSRHGVLVVASAGNSGDLTDAGGSTGNAVRALAVASSVDASQVRDGLRIDGPPEFAGVAAGRASLNFPWATAPDISGHVVNLTDPQNLDGCDPLSDNDSQRAVGRIVWLEWGDNAAARRCGSAARVATVLAAGGIGVLLTSARGVFDPIPIGGTADLPEFQLSDTATNSLRPALDQGGFDATFSASLLSTVHDVNPAIVDTLSSFSSRGVHGSTGVVKPDVAAPGDTIASAGAGTGTGFFVLNGTSMASPHTAGIAALVKQAHPDWTPEQIKAAIMNTADHDIFTEENQGGTIYGPARVGAGRVDALAAVSTTVLAYNADGSGGVSASFGAVQVPITRSKVSKSIGIQLQNTGTDAARLTLSYQGIIAQPGVSYSIRPSSLTIKAGKTARATVTMTVNPGELRHTLDPTMAATQTNPFTGESEARQFVADASGRIVIDQDAGGQDSGGQDGGGQLRVPVYGAAEPTSSTRARDGALPSQGPAIILSGNGFAQGEGPEAFDSMASVMDLGFHSPKEPQCDATTTIGCTSSATTLAGDIEYVGASATPSDQGSRADGWLWFGISTYGDWATVGNSTQPYVDIDTDGDGQPDYRVTVQFLPGTDLLYAVLVDQHTGSTVDLNPVNFAGGDQDTNVFDTNTLLIPVWPAAIGVTDAAASFPIRYTVGTFSNYGTFPNGDIDRTPPVAFDVLNPAIHLAAPLYSDSAGTGISYSLGAPSVVTSDSAISDGQPDDLATQPDSNPYAAAAAQSASADNRHRNTATVLIFHLHGADNHRVQTLTLRARG
jgi:subtilisin family serine protease